MNLIPVARGAVFALAALTLGGCYYTSPYGYAPYYTPMAGTLSQRETFVGPTSAAPSGAVAPNNSTAPAGPPAADVDAQAAAYAPPVYAAYPYPYPYYSPAYYPGWYGWGAPAISVGFWGGWGGGYWRGRGGYGRRPWGGGGHYWGGGGHRH
ncbi:hypothetical protein ACVBGC_00115 [Burkholderia stagnalis]